VARFPDIAGVGDDPARPGLVHRLDRDTSGVMVVARNQASFSALKEIFQKRRAEKTYLAVVCGRMRAQEGAIDFPIGRMARNPTMRGAATGRAALRSVRDALTRFRVLKTSADYTLVELYPKTGRMHQLRVHLKAIGHPVACDTKYGGAKVCCPAGCGRQLLHARALAFSFPEGRRLFFEAEPPTDMALAIRSIF
jgi:RluA family pseudouridine synthase